MDKLVSVIIPMYNAEKYIKRCLQSLIEQTYYHIEIIVVNDGSKDNGKTIVEELAKKDGRIKIFNKENGGVSLARNFGIEKSEGEYIVFVDADDYVSNKYIENLFVAMNSSEDIDLVVSGYCVVSPEGQNVFSHERQNLSKEKAFSCVLLRSGFFSSCAKMFRKKTISMKDLKFDAGIVYAEDALFIVEYVLKMNGFMQVTDDIDYYYDTTHESAINSGFNERKLELIKVYLEIRQKASTFEKERLSVEAAMFSHVEKYYFDMYKEKKWKKQRSELRAFLRQEIRNIKKNPNLSKKSKFILWMTAFRGDAFVYLIKKLRKNV